MSHGSARSARVKSEARTRPDMVWQDSEGEHEVRLEPTQPQDILRGGSELSQRIAEADAHLAAMRKIVQ